MTKTETKIARKPRRMTRKPEAIGSNEPGSASNDDTNRQPSDASQAPGAPAVATKPDKAASKASVVLDVLRRPEGATLEQMVAATGWLPHTTRAVLTGFKKKGHTMTSEKVDGLRTYWVDRTAPEGVANRQAETTDT